VTRQHKVRSVTFLTLSYAKAVRNMATYRWIYRTTSLPVTTVTPRTANIPYISLIDKYSKSVVAKGTI
jgi:hypothetical protein